MPADPGAIELAKFLRIAIGDGECDQELDDLLDAIHARQNVIRQLASAEVLKLLRLGDRVRFYSERLSSRYDGASGPVTKIGRGGKVEFTMGSGRTLICQAYSLEIIEPAPRPVRS